MMRSMVIDMNDKPLHTLAQMRAFLDGTVTIEFSVAVEERYDFIARTVRRFGYASSEACPQGYGAACRCRGLGGHHRARRLALPGRGDHRKRGARPR